MSLNSCLSKKFLTSPLTASASSCRLGLRLYVWFLCSICAAVSVFLSPCLSVCHAVSVCPCVCLSVMLCLSVCVYRVKTSCWTPVYTKHVLRTLLHTVTECSMASLRFIVLSFYSFTHSLSVNNWPVLNTAPVINYSPVSSHSVCFLAEMAELIVQPVDNYVYM